jgi:thiol-disulfide isomerase/thioredoxin
LGGHKPSINVAAQQKQTVMKIIRVLFIPAIALFWTLGLRLLFVYLGWHQADNLKPFRIVQLANILTAWIVPFYWGAWIAERSKGLSLNRCAVSGALILAFTFLFQCLHFGLGTTFFISAPLSLLTGGLLCSLHEIWLPSQIQGIAYGRPQAIGGLIQEQRSVLKMLTVLAVLDVCLVILNHILLYERLHLPPESAQELSTTQAVLFTLPTCPYCEQLQPAITNFQQRHPIIRFRVVEQIGVDARLLRERLNAAYKVQNPTNSPAPALFTASSYMVGADSIVRELKRLATRNPADTIGTRVGLRSVKARN